MLNDSRGSVAVEYAFALPLLLLVFLGIVEFGNLFFERLEISQAAMSGARSGVTAIDNAEAVTLAEAATCNALPAGIQAGLDKCKGGKGKVTAVVDSSGPQNVLRVDISYPYTPILGNALFNLARMAKSDLTLTGLAVLEFQP